MLLGANVAAVTAARHYGQACVLLLLLELLLYRELLIGALMGKRLHELLMLVDLRHMRVRLHRAGS